MNTVIAVGCRGRSGSHMWNSAAPEPNDADDQEDEGRNAAACGAKLLAEKSATAFMDAREVEHVPVAP